MLFALSLHPTIRYRRRVDGNLALIAAIRREVAAADGRITFARFMELALYHPHHGYYATDKHRIGKAGDFFTSVSVGPLFGRILARQFRDWGIDEVTEFGGHRGQLRADILAAAPNLKYRIIETGEPVPETLAGCVFSNEFLDALPVHRLHGDQEVYVDQDFREVLGPLSDPRLPRLPAGYRSEINLRALDWLTDLAHRLQPGAFILTIDYGFERAEYFAPHHADGHLQCYHQHTKNTDPYRFVGQQDITAHVDFTAVMEHGQQLGLKPILFTNQAYYLAKMGEAEIAAIVTRDAGKLSTERNTIHQLLHSTMGTMFRVLIQRKQ
ncbi:MAG: SAM-dependent methyltransferase [Verrucomicrobiota bacterium]